MTISLAFDDDQSDCPMGELATMMFLLKQAHVCISQMILRAQTELKDQFKGFELALTHCGDRIDVQVFTPIDAHQRAVIERVLLLPAEFSPENGMIMVASGFPVVVQGANAQVAQKHKSQLALLSGWEPDGLTQPHTAVCAARFLFSARLAQTYPHWLDHASGECPVSASLRVAHDGQVVSLECYPPREPVAGDTSQCPTFH